MYQAELQSREPRPCPPDCSRKTGFRPTRSSTMQTTIRIRANHNYHSLQVQGTLRPTQGISLQGTYVWSRSLETPLTGSNIANGLLTAPVFTNPTDRNKDYGLSPNHVTHDFRSYGTIELPFGPGKLFLRNSSGWLARLAEGWQTSFIVNLSTGQPVSIASTYQNPTNTTTTPNPTGLYGGSVPDVVGPFSSKGFGKVVWNGDSGNF